MNQNSIDQVSDKAVVRLKSILIIQEAPLTEWTGYITDPCSHMHFHSNGRDLIRDKAQALINLEEFETAIDGDEIESYNLGSVAFEINSNEGIATVRKAVANKSLTRLNLGLKLGKGELQFDVDAFFEALIDEKDLETYQEKDIYEALQDTDAWVVTPDGCHLKLLQYK